MSYSFRVLADTKAAALDKVKEEMASVVSFQPVHATEQAVVMTACESLLEILPDVSEGRDIAISMHGSIWKNPEHGVQQVSLSVDVALSIKK